MTYMDLASFLKSPEKSLLKRARQIKQTRAAPRLFET